MTWGEERDTDDSQGIVSASSDKRPALEEINDILQLFIGKIQQTPPDYSAIKIDGIRAYDAVREGSALPLKSREVVVESLSITHSGEGKTSFLCYCGKGTYIRSLARDMGRKLGCYGHISVLRRLSVAHFNEACAISLEMLEEMVHKGNLTFLRPVESALDDILAWDISPDQAIRIKRGQTIPLAEHTPENTEIMLRSEGKLVAIGCISQGSVKSVRVFNL